MQETKTITLINGGVAMVDADDYETLKEFKWYRNTHGYAHRQGWAIAPSGEREHWNIFMHRVVNNTPIGLYTDHINHSKLDNRKCNLRTVDKSRNSANRPKAKQKRKTMSQFKGVYFNKHAQLWEASVSNRGKVRTTYHKTEAQAALDYNRMAAESFGDFACLNTVPEGTIATVRKQKTSKFWGVAFHARSGLWRSTIEIGRFKTELEAAEAYNKVAQFLRGDKARLNQICPTTETTITTTQPIAVP